MSRFQSSFCNPLTDSSKQRSRLRSKLTTTKAELEECIDGFKLLEPSSELNMEDIQQGAFPWLPESKQGKTVIVCLQELVLN